MRKRKKQIVAIELTLDERVPDLCARAAEQIEGSDRDFTESRFFWKSEQDVREG